MGKLLVLCEVPVELKKHMQKYQSMGDFQQVSIKVLGNVLSGQSKVPWKEMNYLISEVIYGGRMTDEWDKRCLKTLFYKFCNPEMLKADSSFSSNEVRNESLFLIISKGALLHSFMSPSKF